MGDRAVVLGGTGHIGSAITRELLQRGYAVTVLSQKRSRTKNLAGLDVDFRTVRLGMLEALDQALEGAALLVDAGAPYPQGGHLLVPREREALLREAEARTDHLLQAALKHHVAFGYVSTFSTLVRDERGTSGQRWIRDVNRIAHPYFAVKALIESALKQAAGKGIPVTIVNPTFCVGPWDMRPAEQSFVASVALGRLPCVMNGPVNVIDVRDVAHALLEAIEQRIIGRPIPLSGHNTTWIAFHELVSQVARVRYPVIPLPAVPVWVGGYAGELFCDLLGAQAPMPSVVTALMVEHQHVERSELQQRLGTEIRPLRDSLEDSLSWIRAMK